MDETKTKLSHAAGRRSSRDMAHNEKIGVVERGMG
jgi:hypothetical protein